MVSEKIHFVGDGRGYRRVFLNGKKIDRCIYAHEGKGRVVVHRVNADGSLCFDKNKKMVLQKTLYGRVRVESVEVIAA